MIIFEITRDYSIIVPLMIANPMSYFISSRLQREPIYEALQHQDGIHLPPSGRAAPEILTTDDLIGAPAVPASRSLDSALRQFDRDPVRVIRVVDDAGRTAGAITRPEIAIAAAADAAGPQSRHTGLLAGMSVAIVAVALLAAFLNYFYRAERLKRADRAFETANQLYAKERIAEAIEEYRYALSISHRADHWLALAVALVKDGRMNEATIYLNEVLRQNPNSGQANLALAAVLSAGGRIDGAILHYRKAILGTRDADEAVEFYRRIIRSGPPSADEYDGLGQAVFAARDHRAADAAFRKALSIDAADGVAGRRSELIQQVLALDPDRPGLAPRERYRRSQDLLRGALQLVTECGAAVPESVAAETSLAREKAPPSFTDAAAETVELARKVWAGKPASCSSRAESPAFVLLDYASGPPMRMPE